MHGVDVNETLDWRCPTIWAYLGAATLCRFGGRPLWVDLGAGLFGRIWGQQQARLPNMLPKMLPKMLAQMLPKMLAKMLPKMLQKMLPKMLLKNAAQNDAQNAAHKSCEFLVQKSWLLLLYVKHIQT